MICEHCKEETTFLKKWKSNYCLKCGKKQPLQSQPSMVDASGVGKKRKSTYLSTSNTNGVESPNIQKKPTQKQLFLEQVSKAFEDLIKFETQYPQEVIASACNKYSINLRETKKAEKEIKETEEKLAQLRSKRR